MFCCSECKDHLIVPINAVSKGDMYKVIQSFPILCLNSKRLRNINVYNPLCVKEFRENHNRSFLVHVRILAHFTTKLDSKEILVIFSTPNGTYKKAHHLHKKINKKYSKLPDVYFKVLDEKVIIYTKHFTRFIIGKKKRESKYFSQSPTVRNVNLVVHAYFSVNAKERSVVLRVYIRDTLCQDENERKANTDRKEKVKGRCCVDDELLKYLPVALKENTTFQCTIACNQSTWKKMISTLVIRSCSILRKHECLKQ